MLLERAIYEWLTKIIVKPKEPVIKSQNKQHISDLQR